MTPSEFAEKQYNDIRDSAALGPNRHSIRDFRNILEAVFKQLTLSERKLFTDLYARIEYVFSIRTTDRSIRDQVHGLRRMGNRHSHEFSITSHEDWMLSLRAICETVGHFYGQPVPHDLSNLYRSLGGKRLAPELTPKGEVAGLLKVVVLSASQVMKKEGTSYFDMKCLEEDLGEFSLRLWDSADCNLTHLRPLLTQYATVGVTNCRRSLSDTLQYTSTKETLAILAPDLLIDVSDVTKCFRPYQEDISFFLTSKLMPSRMEMPIFKGSIVNSVLDEAVRSPDIGFEKAFGKALRDNFLSGVTFEEDVIKTVRREVAEEHWPNILSITEKLHGRPTRIEPSFLSDVYGLQGRLDLMVESASDPMRNDVFELKSGKPPMQPDHCNTEHRMQVVGYNLLLDSVFQGRRHGSSAVIYSVAKDNTVRSVVPGMQDKSRLLRARNEIVASLIRIAKNDGTVIQTLAEKDNPGLPNFLRQSLQVFGMNYRDAGPLRQTYYQVLLSFMMREILNAKCGMSVAPEREDKRNGFASLWLEPVEEKLRNFSTIAGMIFHSFDPETSLVTFRTDALPYHNFRFGDPVIIHGRMEEIPGPMRQQVVKGRLESIGGDGIKVSLNNNQLSAAHFESFREWMIEHDNVESTDWNICRLLFDIMKPGIQDRFERLAGMHRPEFGAPPDIERAGLNENQASLIRSALSAKDYFLVQGPPGTGKTSTFLTRLVHERLKRPGSLAIVAFTNRAVDEIAQRLTERGIPFERLGSRKTHSKELLAFMEDNDVVKARGYMSSQRVFLSTLASMASQLPLVRKLKDDLDTLVVDEASQLDEAKLAGMLLAFKTFILIGDQNQLPPIVMQDESLRTVTSPLLLEMGMRDLSESIFERLMRNASEKGWDDAYGMLDTHYRMHARISALVEPWYGNRLRIGQETQTEEGTGWTSTPHPEEGPWRDLLLSGRTIFVPSPRRNTSKYHEVEASRIASLLRFMRKGMGEAFNRESIGVVTPWRTQISKIREQIDRDSSLDDVVIDTVERFQGSEKEHILVSFAVCHSGQMSILRTPGTFSHTDDEGESRDIEIDRKLLVTLSRARRQIVVFGDEDILKADPVWASVIERMTRVPLPEGY